MIISEEDVNLAEAEIDSLIGLAGAEARIIWHGKLLIWATLSLFLCGGAKPSGCMSSSLSHSYRGEVNTVAE